MEKDSSSRSKDKTKSVRKQMAADTANKQQQGEQVGAEAQGWMERLYFEDQNSLSAILFNL